MGRKGSSNRRSNLAEDSNAVHESAREERSARVTSIIDASLNELAEQAMAGLNASSVAIALDLDGEMTCRARAGTAAPDIGTPVQRDSGITGECLRTAAVVRCDNTFSDPRVDAATCEQLHIGSILIAPLLRNGKAVGVVEAFFVVPHSYDDVDVDFLRAIAQQIVTLVWGEQEPAKNEGADAAAKPTAAESATPTFPDPEEQRISEAATVVGDAAVEPISAEHVSDQSTESLTYSMATIDSARESSWSVPAIVTVVVTLIVAAVVAIAYFRRDTPGVVARPQESAQAAPIAQAGAPDPMADVRQAAEAGDPAAAYQLARAYKEGSGVAADPQQANAWLRTAAEHGNVTAQVDWAQAQEATAPVEAYTWYVIANQNGSKKSEAAIRRLTPKLTPAEVAEVRLNVGREYLTGHALRRDPVAAYTWLRLAEWGGNASARSEIQNIGAGLTAEQLRRAEGHATDWIRRHTPRAGARNENAAVDLQH